MTNDLERTTNESISEDFIESPAMTTGKNSPVCSDDSALDASASLAGGMSRVLVPQQLGSRCLWFDVTVTVVVVLLRPDPQISGLLRFSENATPIHAATLLAGALAGYWRTGGIRSSPIDRGTRGIIHQRCGVMSP